MHKCCRTCELTDLRIGLLINFNNDRLKGQHQTNYPLSCDSSCLRVLRGYRFSRLPHSLELGQLQVAEHFPFESC